MKHHVKYLVTKVVPCPECNGDKKMCPQCNGKGVVKQDVPLEEALMDPAIIKVIAGAVSRAKEQMQLEQEAAEAMAYAERMAHLYGWD